MLESSPKNQDALASVAGRIAKDVGADLKNPGVKTPERILDKIKRGKTPQQVNDAVRLGFDIQSPGDGDVILKQLASRFEVADEGWQKTEAGYFDRKLMVRFQDGQVGEVQMWAPGMLEAKEGSGGGHRIYEEWQKLPQGDSKAGELAQKMRELYAGVQRSLAPEWTTLFREDR